MDNAIRRLVCISLASVAFATPALAQPRASTLRVVVVDPTGAVIVGAGVAVQPLDRESEPIRAVTNERGEAVLERLPHGRYEITAEANGFAPKRLGDFRLRADARREMKLDLAKLAEEITVGQDPREEATDPRGNAFGNLLTRAQIDALPDDPDEMEETLKQMAGTDAVVRVDGFRGGKLPPKSQIRGIRFRRDLFAAENHGGGMVFVDIMTNPGGGTFRGTADFTFRDDSLNARNPMAPRRGPEQQQNAAFTVSGTLWKDRTGFSFSSNGTNGYDSRTIFAALPGTRLSDVIRRPSERAGFSARLDHALTRSHTLRLGYQRNGSDSDNLGVGDFDLPERAYSRRTNEDLFRLSVNGPVGRHFFSESRFQVRSSETESASLTNSPALIVLDAFNGGGAQVAGGRHATELELASDMDFAKGRHSGRAGVLIEAGRYRSDDVRNMTGTFIFSSLDAFQASQPTTFTQRGGNPLVEFSHAQVAWYAQDDVRINKALSLSLGMRHEMQSHLDDWLNLAPRIGATWSPFRNGRTTVRGGVGLFYDWYDAQTYEQTLRVDGSRQSEIAIRNPGFPDPYVTLPGSSITVLPSGRIVQSRELIMPSFLRSNVAVERSFGTSARLMIGYSYGRGDHLLRGRNLNAPDAFGTRPDSNAGNVTQVESTARSASHMLHTNLRVNLPWHRTNLFVNYTLARLRNDTDGPFSLPANNFDLASEWGPSANDARHRASGLLNMDLWKGLKISTTISGSSGLPYNVTTGFDDNGDTGGQRPPCRRRSEQRARRPALGCRRTFELDVRVWRTQGRRRRRWRWTTDRDPHPRRPGTRIDGRLQRRRGEQALAVRAVPRRHEPVQPHEPSRLQRGHDVTVLRSTDVGAAGPANGGGDQVLLLNFENGDTQLFAGLSDFAKS